MSLYGPNNDPSQPVECFDEQASHSVTEKSPDHQNPDTEKPGARLQHARMRQLEVSFSSLEENQE